MDRFEVSSNNRKKIINWHFVSYFLTLTCRPGWLQWYWWYWRPDPHTGFGRNQPGCLAADYKTNLADFARGFMWKQRWTLPAESFVHMKHNIFSFILKVIQMKAEKKLLTNSYYVWLCHFNSWYCHKLGVNSLFSVLILQIVPLYKS